jgi:DNA invertase Pin-like site-specific DNA recombinase
MTTQAITLITDETLDEYIIQAAKAAGYEKGFGIRDCDLSKPIWWAAYCRQSLDQQTQNNRLPEYLLTLAKMARDYGVVVPREYVLYDHETGEHLERHNMAYMRYELAHKKHILGIMFADIRCLSREPAPQQVFERECELQGIKLMFGDAPSGMDVGSQFVRSALTFSNKLTRLATNRNARAGNIGRVLKGWVPSTKAPYGYRYQRDAEITQGGKIQIKQAWWDVDELDLDGKPLPESPAGTVVSIFRWLGIERRSSYWVACKLNEMGIKAPGGGKWSPTAVCGLAYRQCYTGKHRYNANARVHNPDRPLGDVTGSVGRTVLRPKPEGEAVEFSVPSLVSEELWNNTNDALRRRGRGHGKQGKTIAALLRGRIFCPRCGKPMVVRRKSGQAKTYYYCSRYYKPWSKEPCTYRSFIPGNWDDLAWDCVCALLQQDAWLEQQLAAEENHLHNLNKLIKLEQHRILQAQTKITKIQEGFEAGLYTIEEAKSRIANCQKTIAEAERETNRSEHQMSDNSTVIDVDALRQELKSLGEKNLDEATFEDRRDILNKLDIRVYPSEDLKTVKVKCGLSLDIKDKDEIADVDGCRIVVSGLQS